MKLSALSAGNYIIIRIAIVTCIVFFGLTLIVADAYAASRYEAELVGDIHQIQLRPYEQKIVELKFKNLGTRSWRQDTLHYTSLYTDPSTRGSLFSYYGWFGKGQPTLMDETSVEPGGIATFRLPLQAPGKLGDYNEKFKLAVEDIAWIKGSNISLPIKVTKTPKVPDAGEGLSANILLRSHESIESQGGKNIELRFGIKNVGPRTWKQIKVIEPGVALVAEGDESLFYSDKWPQDRVALALGEQEYKTGQLALIGVPVKMPRDVGKYTLKLQLTSENENVGGGLIELPVTITSPAPEEIKDIELPVENPIWVGVEEPLMRVGISLVPDMATFTMNGPYKVVDGEGQDYGVIEPGVSVELVHDGVNNQQLIRFGENFFKTKSYFRLEPVDPISGVVTITSLDRQAKWNRSINYNEYRGVVELRRNNKGYTWIVNELPMEDYLKGLSEASNPWPMEFHKAQATVARSYALYYHERGGKHKSTGSQYILNSGSYDQVYKGYTAEKLNTRYVDAVNASRGVVVRYQGEVAITPYFARSHGHTHTWQSKWGGRGKPYITARKAEYDASRGVSQWGHGVGMPQTDARRRAEDGFDYKEILHAYYTNVTVDRIYE